MIARVLLAARQALSTTVLLVLWVVVLIPTALLSRIVRGDVLGRPDPAVASYWEPPRTSPEDGLFAFFASSGKLWLLPVVLLILGLGVLLVASESSLVLAFLYPLF